MYGKLFETAFTGSMMGSGANVFAVWAYAIANADKSGHAELNPKHLAVLIGIGVDEVDNAINFLCQPDPYSRSQDQEGRRLMREGQFLYRLVNHSKYQKIVSEESKREADRHRMAEKRHDKKTKENMNDIGVTCDCRKKSQKVESVAEVAHVDVDVDVDKRSNTLSGDARLILSFLNEKTGRNYQPVKANLALIVARMKEGASAQDCKTLIARKVRDWKSDEKMEQYLRPKTLFNATNFANYMGECVAKGGK